MLDNTRNIIIQPFQMKSSKVMKASHGSTIIDIVNQMYDASGVPAIKRDYNLMVEVEGVPVPRARWNSVPDINSHVLVSVLVHGGKEGSGVLRAILMLAVVVVAIYTGGAAGALFGAKGSTAFMIGSTVTSMMVMTAGMLLVNAIAPIRLAEAGGVMGKQKDVYGITGASNQANPFGPVPVVLGRHKMYPLYGAAPYTELVGNDEYLRMLFVWGYGPLKIENIKIGETLLTEYEDVEEETREGLPDDLPITLIPHVVIQQQINLELVDPEAEGWKSIIRQASPGADELSVDVLFPAGLVQYTSDGGKAKAQSDLHVHYREVGEEDWIEAGNLFFKEKKAYPLRFGFQWKVDNTKTYEVMCYRDVYYTSGNVSDTLMWTNLRSIKTDQQPVNFPYPVAMTALRIKATNQLNGIISQLNGIVTSYAPTWDGDAWTEEAAVTQNPAALYRMVLKHPANARARTDAQINGDELGAWYEFCETNGYKFNMIRDAVSSVWNTCADICAAGRGSPSLSDGKWGVVCDVPDAAIVQHITPRNSWGFSASKTLFHHPHGFRIQFKNEDNDWKDDERIVYDDGYDEDTATQFEGIPLPGITDPDLIWKFGRYHIAQARLRPEIYTLNMDFEHLVCRRGSKVLVSHDVPMWGTKWGRIKKIITESIVVEGGVFTDRPDAELTFEDTPYAEFYSAPGTLRVTGIQLDERFPIMSSASYVMRVRRNDENNTSQIMNLAEMATGEYDTVTLAESLAPDDPLVPVVGDLVIIGELGKETTECLVKGIYSAGDLSARLELVDVGAAIYEADTGDIPPFETNITRISDITLVIPAVPYIVNLQSGTATLEISSGGYLSPRIFATCGVITTDIRIGRFEVSYRAVDTTKWAYADCSFDKPTAYLTDVEEGESYQIRARSISVYGIESEWSEIVIHTVIGESELPTDVTAFICNILGSEAHLSWNPVLDIDLSHYRVRWSPLTTGADWEDSIDIVARVGKPSTSVTVPTMVGSYLIKAVDYRGGESTNAATAKTNVVRIPGFTNAATISQPAWSGTPDDTEYDAGLGGIILSEESEGVLHLEGTYTLTGSTDLGGIYTSRISAALTTSAANILDDLYDHIDLYSSANLYGVLPGQCGVTLEIRFTDDDPAGTPTWSSWQAIFVGDFTARAYQFRLKLWSQNTFVTPIVEAVSIYVDMANRTYGFDQAISSGGSTVTFARPFYATPSLSLSIINGQAGDTYTISSQTRISFAIAFTNGGGNVARTISGVAKGYGEEEI